MPLHIDPAWEYWTPQDPEISEIFESKEHGYNLLFDSRLYKAGLLGLRYGVGNPDSYRPILRREPYVQQSRNYLKECIGCGSLFPRKVGNYCTKRCARLHDSRSLGYKTCEGCSCQFHPSRREQRFCSLPCANRNKGDSRAVEFIMSHVGPACKVCGTALTESTSANKTPKKYCSKKCKHVASNRAYYQRARDKCKGA